MKNSLTEYPLYKVWRLSVAAAVTLAGLVFCLFYFAGAPLAAGRKQPIAFSHRLHVQDKHIDCRYCHPTVDRSARAGLPAVELCLGCHTYIIPHHPEIRKIHDANDRNAPIPWVRVNNVPEHCRFQHATHIARELDCAECHGAVETMDRVRPTYRLDQMGFCIRCHRRMEATLDCAACHY